MFEDMIDPMALIERNNRMMMQPWQRPPQPGDPKLKIEPLPEEQEQALLPRISGAALGGLGAVGSFLEKTFGDRAVRGLLAGKPRELLSVLPFSDTLGITDEADRTSGRDLLRKWGMADREDTWGNFAGGMGLELALSPSMWFTLPIGGGALTQAGRVADKIKALPPTLRGRLKGTLTDVLSANPSLRPAAETAAGGAPQLQALMNESLSGLGGVKLPFSEWFGAKPTALLTGKTGEAVLDTAGAVGSGIASANKYLSELPAGLGFAYRNFTPPGVVGQLAPAVGHGLDVAGRHLKAMFNSRVMGAVNAPAQRSAERGFEEIAPFAAKYRERLAGYMDELKRAGATGGDELTMAIENVRPSANPVVNQVAARMRGDYAEMLAEAQRLGLNIEQFHDVFHPTLGYGPRHWSAVVEGGGNLGGGTAAILAARDPAVQTRRLKMLSGINEGTVGVNKMFQDAAIFGDPTTRAARAQHIISTYLRDPNVIAAEQIAAGSQVPLPVLVQEITRQQARQARTLARYAEVMPEQFAQAAAGQLLDKAGNPIRLTVFGHNPVDEMMNYIDRFARMRGQAVGAHDIIANNYKLGLGTGVAPHVPARGEIGAHEALRKAGLNLNAPAGTAMGAHQTLLNAINARRAAQGMVPLTDLSPVFLDKKIADDIARVMRGFDAPEAVNPLIRGYDSFTRMFKDLVTGPWPGFNIRNLASGQVQNLAKGATGTLQDSLGAYNLGKGLAWEGLEQTPAIRDALVAAGRPVTAEEATKWLARQMFAWRTSGHAPHIGQDVVSMAGDTIKMPRQLDDVLGLVAGQKPQSFLDALKAWGGGSGNPKGTWWPLSENFHPVLGGRVAGEVVENMNRAPLFVQRLREGFTPEQAARDVLASHYSYTKEALTPFEKTVMRRLIPFYSYTRQNLPQIVQQLGENPGGLAGVLAKTSLATRQQGGFLPKYLGEGLAIPLTSEDEQGMKRYLTRLDFPADQAFEFYKGTTGDPLQASIMGLLSQLNPLPKGLAEYALDKQFYSGRELGDLYGLTGNQLVDQALFNSPFARLATTARQVMDPRKWDMYSLPLNLLTGAKVTDVDMPKYRTIAEREYIKERLRGLEGVGKFETIYPKMDKLHTLTPEEYQLVQLQKLLEKRAREEKKRQK